LIFFPVEAENGYPRMLKETDEGWVIAAKGCGKIIQDDRLAAISQAERDAMRNALEFQIGSIIGSRTVVRNLEMGYDVIDAHVEGYAKKLGRIEEPSTDSYGNINVVLKVLVSKKAVKVTAKLGKPESIFVGPELKARSKEAEMNLDTVREKVFSKLERILIRAGYKVPYVPRGKTDEVRKLIDELSWDLPLSTEEEGTKAERAMKLSIIADYFLTGKLSVAVRKFIMPAEWVAEHPNLANSKVVEINGNVQLLGIDLEDDKVWIIDKGDDKDDDIKTTGKGRLDSAIDYAVDDIDIDNFISRIDKDIGEHRRLIVLFVKGIQMKREYTDLIEWLSNSDPAIERAQGVIFDPTMSRIILRLNRQIMENALAEVTGHLANVLDHTSDWKLVKHGNYTIMIDREK